MYTRPSSLRARSLSLSVISERPFLIKLSLSNFYHNFQNNATRLATVYLIDDHSAYRLSSQSNFPGYISSFINLMHFRDAREILCFCDKCVECRPFKATAGRRGFTRFNFRIRYDVRSEGIFSTGYAVVKSEI